MRKTTRKSASTLTSEFGLSASQRSRFSVGFGLSAQTLLICTARQPPAPTLMSCRPPPHLIKSLAESTLRCNLPKNRDSNHQIDSLLVTSLIRLLSQPDTSSTPSRRRMSEGPTILNGEAELFQRALLSGPTMARKGKETTSIRPLAHSGQAGVEFLQQRNVRQTREILSRQR